MTSIHLTSANEIPATGLRRVLVAAVVLFTLGAAGAVVGRAASNDDGKSTVAPTVHVEQVEEATAELASAKIAPEVAATVVDQDKLVPVVVVTPTVKTIEMEVTAYCPCTKCCGPKAQGITASGKNVHYNDGQFVAADKKFAFGTKLIIPGYAGSKTVEVTDRGGAIKGNKLDVYFHSHAEALKWGRQKLTVTVIE
jgi:3D (Asp-Asp-Asp) domain-containing protein